MTVILRLQNELEEIRVPGEIMAAMNLMNVAAANGQTFVALGDNDDPIVINMRNINLMRGEDSAIFDRD